LLQRTPLEKGFRDAAAALRSIALRSIALLFFSSLSYSILSSYWSDTPISAGLSPAAAHSQATASGADLWNSMPGLFGF